MRKDKQSALGPEAGNQKEYKRDEESASDADDDNEEYDYLQHMKPMGQVHGAVFIANPHFKPHSKGKSCALSTLPMLHFLV